MAEENKVSGLPLGLLAFLPFILFGCASAANHWRIATGGGLLLSLFYLGVLYRRGIVIKLMEWITLTVFIIGSVLTIGMRWALFPLYNEVLIWSCFAVAAWMSVAIGRPVHDRLCPRKRAAGVLATSNFSTPELRDESLLVWIAER